MQAGDSVLYTKCREKKNHYSNQIEFTKEECGVKLQNFSKTFIKKKKDPEGNKEKKEEVKFTPAAQAQFGE